jgi:molybdopterin synthase catalytic subunit
VLAVSPDPINHAAVQAAVADDAHGAVTYFAGVVRDHHEGKAVTHIDYEVHADMARTILAGIAAEVAAKWPDATMACVHRHGVVQVGEASVAIAVSTPHRAESFDACRYVIERIKQDLPVWKKEFHPDGSHTWAACHHPGEPE